jgi:hypothetical protein
LVRNRSLPDHAQFIVAQSDWSEYQVVRGIAKRDQRRHTMKIINTILASALVASGICAFPQNLDRKMTVIVPFDFTVRDTNLHAGKYTVTQEGPVIFVTSWNGKTGNIMTNQEYTAKPATHSSLTFTKRNGEYALTEVTNQGSNTELVAVPSKHAAKRLEASNNAPQTVEVAALGTR